MATPIEPGGFITGLIAFEIPRVKLDQLKNAHLSYCFDSMDNRRYCMTEKLSNLNTRGAELPRYPGERIN